MRLPMHALVATTIGIVVIAALIAAGSGTSFLFSLPGVSAVAIVSFPLLVLTIAAFIGRNRKAGRGAIAFAWLFVVLDVVAVWSLSVSARSANDPIGIAWVVAAELLVASSVVALAALQRPLPHAGNAT